MGANKKHLQVAGVAVQAYAEPLQEALDTIEAVLRLVFEDPRLRTDQSMINAFGQGVLALIREYPGVYEAWEPKRGGLWPQCVSRIRQYRLDHSGFRD